MYNTVMISLPRPFLITEGSAYTWSDHRFKSKTQAQTCGGVKPVTGVF